MALNASPGVNVTPTAEQVAVSTNYITNFDFLNQYLPDVYKEEFERYGNRSVASFLRAVSAEIPFASDLIKWTEQGRLHIIYQDCASDAAANADTATITVSDTLPGGNGIAVRVGQTVHLYDNDTATNAGSNKAIVTAVDTAAGTFDVAYYEGGGQKFAATDTISVYIYGSEFKKGTDGMVGSNESQTEFLENNPVIIKDFYEVAASDMAQIGWVEITSEAGGSGFLWYLKSQAESRLRFEDYLETELVEGVPAETGSGALLAGMKGTKGLFYTLENDANVWGGGVPETLSEYDTIIKRLDQQGAIEENMLFLDRDFDLAMDDMLAAQNSYGASGTSYGVFNNSESMALSLKFTGFRRAYDFYKTDWKYLNDPTMRGSMPDEAGSVKGVMVPAGTKTVYDEILGKNLKRPFLHVRYRKSETEDRKYKSWVVGSAGGANNSGKDSMGVHMLSERALCTVGANNFFIFKGA